MKIWVDKLPESCYKCPLSYSGNMGDNEFIGCQKTMQIVPLDAEKLDDCPLHPLSELIEKTEKKKLAETEDGKEYPRMYIPLQSYNNGVQDAISVIKEAMDERV